MDRLPRRIHGLFALVLALALFLPNAALAGAPVTPMPAVPGPGTITSEQAAAAAKAAFDVPASLTEFRANYWESAGPVPRKTWSLNWTEPARADRFRGQESMSFEIDAVTGEVRGMNRYRVLPDGSSATAINLTRDEAQVKAVAVIARLQASRLADLKLDPPAIDQYLYPAGLNGPVIYNFNWTRVMNGISVANDGLQQGAWVNVDASDGAVVGYGSDWSDLLTYPDPKGAITAPAAMATWLDKLGLELQYQTVTDPLGVNTKPKAALIYAWRIPYYGFAVDALTGKVTDNRGQEYDPATFTQSLQWPTVTPAPALQGPVSREQALGLATSVLGLGQDWELSNAGYNDNTDYSPEPTWSFNWTRTTGSGDNKRFENASATIGARTGLVLNMYHYLAGDQSQAPVLTRDEAMQKALSFIATYAPGEIGQLRPAFNYQPGYPGTPGKQPRGYNFNFERLVGGVPFPASTVGIGVDGVTGEITNFYSNAPAIDGGFPDKSAAMDMTKAAAAFRQEVGLELIYRPAYKNDAAQNAQKFGPWTDTLEPQAQLVYQLPSLYRGLRLDAVAGRLVDNSGRDVKLLMQPPKDVAGHWAEREILIVAARGLLGVNSDGLFEPAKVMTRAEAARLVVLAFGRSEIRPMGPRFADVAMKSMYAGYIESAAQAGWLDVTDSSFRPDDPMTREVFAGMLVRALGYSRVAKMPVQIPLTYGDAAGIDPALRNSVALAAGLGIFGAGGQFRPKDGLTRAEAAVTVLRVARAR